MNKLDTDFGEFAGYRFGFNGKEADSDKEWGSATHYDYGFRIYNPSIGKFLSVDPLAPDYPWYTPYQFAGNMPITSIDLDGLEQANATHWTLNEQTNTYSNGTGGIARRATDSDVYYYTRKTFLFEYTYISNSDNTTFLADPVRVTLRSDIQTGTGYGLSLDIYQKGNYTEGLKNAAFYGIGGALVSPLVSEGTLTRLATQQLSRFSLGSYLKSTAMNYVFEVGSAMLFEDISKVDHFDALNPIKGRAGRLLSATINLDADGLSTNSLTGIIIESSVGEATPFLEKYLKDQGGKLLEKSTDLSNYGYSWDIIGTTGNSRRVLSTP